MKAIREEPKVMNSIAKQHNRVVEMYEAKTRGEIKEQEFKDKVKKIIFRVRERIRNKSSEELTSSGEEKIHRLRVLSQDSLDELVTRIVEATKAATKVTRVTKPKRVKTKVTKVTKVKGKGKSKAKPNAKRKPKAKPKAKSKAKPKVKPKRRLGQYKIEINKKGNVVLKPLQSSIRIKKANLNKNPKLQKYIATALLGK